MSATGELTGSEIAISTEGSEKRVLPFPCYSSEYNEYLVVYAKAWDVYGRFINADGSLRGEEFVICDAQGVQNHPTPAFNPTYHNYFVVWNDDRLGENEADIHAALVNRDGTLAEEAFPVCNVPNDQMYTAMTYNSHDDEFLVTWEDIRNCTTDPCWMDLCNIVGQRVGSDGKLLGDEIVIINGISDQRMQNLAYNPNRNEYMVVWNDNRNEPAESIETYLADIYGIRIGGEGTVVGNDFPVVKASELQVFCTIAYHPSLRNYLVTWGDYREYPGSESGPFGKIYPQHIYDPGIIYARWLNEDGMLLGEEFPICTESIGSQLMSSIVFNSTNGNFLVVWSDVRNEENGQDVYGKIIQACPLTGILAEKESLNLLRQFRDLVLAQTPLGKECIQFYYQHAAEISSLFQSNPILKHAAAAILEELLPYLKHTIQEEKRK